MSDRTEQLVNEWYGGNEGKIEVELARRSAEAMMRARQTEIVEIIARVFDAWHEPLGDNIAQKIRETKLG